MALYMNSLTLLILIYITTISGLRDLLNSEEYECVKCLCHAVSGCRSLYKCSELSINMSYWEDAGSPVVNSTSDDPDENGYKKCMDNNNCIVTTIIGFTNQSSDGQDCNCDGKYDCFDRLAVHYGQCNDFTKILIHEERKGRYENCSKTKNRLCS